MQDNAPIYITRKVRFWFKIYEVEVMEWPPYSPDLNPIKYLWYRLKKLVYTRHPELLGIGGSLDKMRKAMIKVMLEVWEEVGEKLRYNLIDSMTTRVNAILAAEGWYTRF